MDRSTDHKACTSLNSSMDLERMRSILGEGPSRFAPTAAERNIQEQLDSLSTEERECVEALIDKWDTKFPGDPLEDVMVLRCARNSHVPFHAHEAWTMMKKLRQPHNSRLLTLGATKMEKHLEGKLMFPLPGLKTRNNHDVLYMKSARFVPGETSSNIMIDQLAYCINSMYEKESTCRDGIAFMANMKDWTMRKHFSTRHTLKFANMVQGKNLPVRVNLFLIVNPQPWFHKVWAIVRPMLSDEFASKVFMIPESQLSEHLMDGYEQFLPDEMATSSGSTNTQQVVSDYIHYRIFLETGRVPMRLVTSTTTASPKPSKLKKALTMESSSSQQSSLTKVTEVVASPPCNLRRMLWFKKKPVALQP